MRLLFAVLILAISGCRFSYECQIRPASKCDKPVTVEKTATVILGKPVVKPDTVPPVIPSTPLLPD